MTIKGAVQPLTAFSCLSVSVGALGEIPFVKLIGVIGLAGVWCLLGVLAVRWWMETTSHIPK